MDLDLSIEDVEPKLVVTNLMVRTARRTSNAILNCGLVIWCGLSRIGKTRTARWIRDFVNDEFKKETPGSYAALYFEIGGIRANYGNQQKQSVSSLYAQVVGASLSDYVYKRSSVEVIAAEIVKWMQRKSLRLIFIDEVGNLSLEAIRGLVLVRDVAENMGWKVAFVFIGMDDLPSKIEQLPQIKGRINSWCYFQEYSLAETKRFLAGIHPHFEQPEPWSDELEAEAAFIFEAFGGYPGHITTFLQHVDEHVAENKWNINLTVLKAIRRLELLDRERAIEDERRGHVRSVPSIDGDAKSTKRAAG